MVAEGALRHSGVFAVAALGFPPAELRAESQVATKVAGFPVACPAERAPGTVAHAPCKSRLC